MIMTVMLSGYSLPSLFLASVSTKRNSACASTLPFKLVIPYESTIPTIIWYLLAIPIEDFLVPSQNLIQKFPFCNRTSSWCGEGKSVSSMPKIFYSMTKFYLVIFMRQRCRDPGFAYVIPVTTQSCGESRAVPTCLSRQGQAQNTL